MKVVVYDYKTGEVYASANISIENIHKKLSTYEYIHMYDKKLLYIVAIEIVIKKIFGEDSEFVRDMSIRNYICGDVKKNNFTVKEVSIYFE